MAPTRSPRKQRFGRPSRWLFAGCLALLGAASAPIPATAAAAISQKRVLPYPYAQVYTTALRYLRVDRGYAVTDHDAEAGYILFEFPVGDVRGTGSLEAFATEDAAGRPGVSVKVTTGAGPVYLPHSILDGLSAKVKAERGQPPPPPPSEPPPAPPSEDEVPKDGGPPPTL